MLKAIFLDLDHTLCDTDGIDEQAYAHTMTLAVKAVPELDPEQLRRDYHGLLTRQPFPPDPTMPVSVWRTGFWRMALGAQSADTKELPTYLHDSYYNFRNSIFCFRPGVTEMLSELRKQWKLIIVTNGPASIQRPKLEVCKADDYCDGIIVSGEQSYQKPDAGIFQLACKMAGCEAAEAMHVGDDLESDIQGGINARLAATIWLAPADAPDSPMPKPTHIITDILDLPAVAAQV